jgi:hypothetical protein
MQEPYKFAMENTEAAETPREGMDGVHVRHAVVHGDAALRGRWARRPAAGRVRQLLDQLVVHVLQQAEQRDGAEAGGIDVAVRLEGN